MTRRLITILIIGQIALDLAFIAYIWADVKWQHSLTNILEAVPKEGIEGDRQRHLQPNRKPVIRRVGDGSGRVMGGTIRQLPWGKAKGIGCVPLTLFGVSLWDKSFPAALYTSGHNTIAQNL